MSESFQDLIDDYLSELLDETRLRALEERLRCDADARRYFVRYARLHTDLHLEARARRASAQALDRIEQLTQPTPGPVSSSGQWRFLVRYWALAVLVPAACLLLAIAAGWWFATGRLGREGTAGEPAIAWLVNAQNCQWSEEEPAGDMHAGKMLRLERGLAQVRFRCGARVVLESPADLELLSGRSARLWRGKLTARAPGTATGFEILSPQGKVIDLGTEFGVAVSANDTTDVYVFEGKVEAHPAGSLNTRTAAVSLTRNQAARMAAGQVTVKPSGPEAGADQFVREIVPPPVILPKTFRLTFDRAVDKGIRDVSGSGIGLTHRLPGTGSRLPQRDPNLRLDPARAQLELTTTNSDLNTQFQLHGGEYLGVSLSDLGFTGKEDFAITVTLPNIPPLEFVGQFGLYAGARSDRNIRGGLISRRQPGEYTQFLVNNNEGIDDDFGCVGLVSTGADLRLTLKRTGGKYALTAENFTAGSASTLTIRHPEFLDGERDLFVGLFGANTQSEVRKTLIVKEFQVTVWIVSPAARR
jgi:hypothetical protein